VVAHEQQHAVAGLQARRPQAGTHAGRALRPLRVAGHGTGAAEEGWAVGVFQRLALQQVSEVHAHVSDMFWQDDTVSA